MSRYCNDFSYNDINLCNANNLSNAINIDVAYICQEYTPIELVCNKDHIIELDEISITEENFKTIFYPYGENFGLDKKAGCNPEIFPYVTFLPKWRTVDTKPFVLLDYIIMNIEADLNVDRNCFTTSSLIELSKELSSIKSLYDINCCSVVASLTWSNILNIIRNNYECNKTLNYFMDTILIISIVFKTPNIGILPTTIKFKYRVDINIEHMG
jgi:hypothetical protein